MRGGRSGWMAWHLYCWVGLALSAVATGGTELHAQWVEAPGSGWLDLTASHQDTRRQFGPMGEVGDIFAEGHAVNSSVSLTATVGLLPGLDAWMQVPYHRLEFTDSRRRTRRSSGIGDTQLHLRLAPLQRFELEFPLALRGGVKLPVGDFDLDALVIPLGDGQRDWEMMVELGHSFYPFPAYVGGWVGHRWRTENSAIQRDFANEAFFLLQTGGSGERFGLQAVAEGMKSVESPIFEGIPLPAAKRSLLQITPSLTAGLGPGVLSGGIRIPVRGRNLPAGPAWVVSYFSRWSLRRFDRTRCRRLGMPCGLAFRRRIPQNTKS